MKTKQEQLKNIKNKQEQLSEKDMKIIRDYFQSQTQRKIFDDTFLRIPKAIVNKDMSIQAKYLYGFIYGYISQGGTVASNAYMMDFLGCTKNSLAKYINELKKNECIRIEISNNNRRTIYPLITEGLQIVSDDEMMKYFMDHYEWDEERHQRQKMLLDFMSKMR